MRIKKLFIENVDAYNVFKHDVKNQGNEWLWELGLIMNWKLSRFCNFDKTKYGWKVWSEIDTEHDFDLFNEAHQPICKA